jgi:hypothetical protein
MTIVYSLSRKTAVSYGLDFSCVILLILASVWKKVQKVHHSFLALCTRPVGVGKFKGHKNTVFDILLVTVYYGHRF